jgi:F0F1-type ATP synthase membrane subunit b/b'
MRNNESSLQQRINEVNRKLANAQRRKSELFAAYQDCCIVVETLETESEDLRQQME